MRIHLHHLSMYETYVPNYPNLTDRLDKSCSLVIEANNRTPT